MRTIPYKCFIAVITVIALYPIIWNFYSALKTNEEFLSNAFALPKSLQFINFVRAWGAAKIGANFMNSVYAVLVLLVVVVACVIPCSYVLARYVSFSTKLILSMFMAAIFIKATYIMIPLFLQMNSIGMTNKLVPYAVLYAVTQFPFSVFLMVGYMKTIPKDFEEAAMIDGYKHFRILTQIIVPMAKPGIMTVCMLSAIAIWNEYPVALVMLTKDSAMTLPIGLALLNVRAGYYADYGSLFAALVIVLIPTIIFFSIGQRYLIQGVSAGGVKE